VVLNFTEFYKYLKIREFSLNLNVQVLNSHSMGSALATPLSLSDWREAQEAVDGDLLSVCFSTSFKVGQVGRRSGGATAARHNNRQDRA